VNVNVRLAGRRTGGCGGGWVSAVNVLAAALVGQGHAVIATVHKLLRF